LLELDAKMVQPKEYKIEDILAHLLTKKWTLMYYMSGENERWMESDLAEVAGHLDEADIFPEIGVVVMFDRRSTGMAELYYLDWDPLTRRNKRVMKKGFPAPRNMGESDTLRELIEYAKENCPAERYALMILGHGSSFMGVAHDNLKDALSMREIASAIRDADIHLDLIVFDACSMASLEVGLLIKDYVDYMAASEDTVSGGVPAAHLFHKELISEIINNPDVNPADLSKKVVEVYDRTHKGLSNDYTFSAINLLKLSDVLDKLDHIPEIFSFDPLLENYDKLVEIFIKARKNVCEYFRGRMIDIYDFVSTFEKLLMESNIDSLTKDFGKEILTPVKQAIEDPSDPNRGAVMMSRSGPYRRRSHGLDIYFPKKPDQIIKYYEKATNPIRQMAPKWTELVIKCASNEKRFLFLISLP